MRRTLVLTLMLLAGSSEGFLGQPPGPARIVADLVQTPRHLAFPFLPGGGFQKVGDAHLFAYDDNIHGAELWRTDGTDAGTWLVKDICPGSCVGVPGWDGLLLGGSYYFPANDGEHGMELWVSDGTPEGTRLLVDLIEGPASSDPIWIRALDDRLYWWADHSDGGRAVWTRVEAGDPIPLFVSEIDYFNPIIVLEDTVLFVAEEKLWSVDESLVVTGLRHSTLDVAGGGHPATQDHWRPWVVHDDKVFFRGTTSTSGTEPWVSDGSSDGTTQLGDLSPGTGSSYPRWFAILDGAVVFVADGPSFNSELWTTQGTPGDPEALLDSAAEGPQYIGRILVSDGQRILFQASTVDSGAEPWISDGTQAGTYLLKDIQPGEGSSLDTGAIFYASESGAGGGKLFFPADDGIHGLEPWITDGTSEGTELLANINSETWNGEDYGSLGFLSAGVNWTGSQFLFVATEGGSAGREPWTSDGTPSGTHAIADLAHQPSSFSQCYFPPTPCSKFQPTEDGVFFTAMQERTIGDPDAWIPKLHRTEGSAGTTREVPLSDAEGELEYVFLTPFTPSASVGPRIVLATDSNGSEIWSTDGTPEGTTELVDLQTAENPYPLLGPFGSIGDQVAFFADGELWLTDGTPPNTMPTGAPGPPLDNLVGALPAGHLVVGDTFYWGAPGEIWSLPVAGSPSLLISLPGSGTPSFLGALPASPTPRLVFWYDDGLLGTEPWILAGGGAVLLREVSEGSAGSQVRYSRDLYTENYGIFHLAATTGNLVFFVADGGAGPTLWRTDGSSAGTVPVETPWGELPGWPRSLAALGNRVFFAAEGESVGMELWVTDGTPAGTGYIDILAGPGSSLPRELTPLDEGVLFSAFQPGTGVELWYSEGTPASTALYQDLHPGPGSSSPVHLAVGADRVWFAATDGTHGFEPWRLWLVEGIFADGFETGDATRWSTGE